MSSSSCFSPARLPSPSPPFCSPAVPCGLLLRPSGKFSSFGRVLCQPIVCGNAGMMKFPRFVARASSSAADSLSGVVPPDIGDVLGEVSIFTAAGEPVLFRDLWDQTQVECFFLSSLFDVWPIIWVMPCYLIPKTWILQPGEDVAVVALLRHFGCVCCWELASSLRDEKARFDAAGVKLIAVGVGTPDKAQILAERLPFPMDCLYADPTRKAYDVLGLYFGLGRTFFNPASRKVFSRFEAIKKAVKNYTINATPDDRSSVLQQGGMFVFKGKELLYARKDEGTGDHAPLDDVFEVCCKIPVS